MVVWYIISVFTGRLCEDADAMHDDECFLPETHHITYYLGSLVRMKTI